MLTSRHVVGALCVVVVLGAACSTSGAEPDDGATEVSPSPTVDESPTPAESEPSTPDDPFAMPDPVTEEYVDRVVNTIYEEWGAITREILEQDPDPTGTTPVETRERIAALFGGEYLQQRFEEADRVWRGERDQLLPAEEFSSFVWSTGRIYEATASCLVAAGDIDASGTARTGPTILTAVSLVRDPTNENPTGWKVIDAQSNVGPGGEVLDDDVMLEAELANFGEILTVECKGEPE